MKTFTFFVVMLLLLCVPAAPVFPQESGAQQDNTVVIKVGDKTITLSQFNALLKEIGQRKGSRLNPDEKKRLMETLVQEELFYLHAIAQGVDKTPEAIEKAQAAMKKTIVIHFLDSYLANFRATDAEIKEYYEKNKQRYNRPAIYNGFFYYITAINYTGDPAKLNDITNALDNIMTALKAHIVENGYKPLQEPLISNIRKANPEYVIDLIPGDGYYQGKATTIQQPALDAYVKLTQNSLASVAEQTRRIIAVLQDIVPGKEEKFETVKNRVIAEVNTEKAQKAYFELIERLSKQYNPIINYDILK